MGVVSGSLEISMIHHKNYHLPYRGYISRGFNFTDFTVLKNSRKFLSMKIIFTIPVEEKCKKFFLVNRLKGDFREIFSPRNIPPIRYVKKELIYRSSLQSISKSVPMQKGLKS